MDKNIEISKEQAKQIDYELFYNTDLIADVKNFISENADEYERYLDEFKEGDK